MWIVTASPYTEMQLHVSQAVLDYLAQLETCLVYRGRDGKSFVYKIPAQCHNPDEPDPKR